MTPHTAVTHVIQAKAGLGKLRAGRGSLFWDSMEGSLEEGPQEPVLKGLQGLPRSPEGPEGWGRAGLGALACISKGGKEEGRV